MATHPDPRRARRTSLPTSPVSAPTSPNVQVRRNSCPTFDSPTKSSLAKALPKIPHVPQARPAVQPPAPVEDPVFIYLSTVEPNLVHLPSPSSSGSPAQRSVQPPAPAPVEDPVFVYLSTVEPMTLMPSSSGSPTQYHIDPELNAWVHEHCRFSSEGQVPLEFVYPPAPIDEVVALELVEDVMVTF